MSLFRRTEEPKKVSGFGEPVKYESKNKIIAWFKNYWYYYKIPIYITAVLLFFGIWIIHDVTSKNETDFHLYTVTNFMLTDEWVAPITDIVEEYATDIDGDGKTNVYQTYLNLASEPADELQIAAYQKIMVVFADETITLMLVDEPVYKYLKASEALAPLSEFGLDGMGVDDYRIRATDSFLIEDTIFANSGEYYLAFRIRLPDTAGDPMVEARYETAVKIASDVAADTEQVLPEENNTAAQNSAN